jgi:hypothetical protein
MDHPGEIPYFPAEAFEASMKVVTSVIHRQLNRMTIQGKPAAADPVDRPSYHTAKIIRILLIISRFFESCYYTLLNSIPIRSMDRRDNASQVGDTDRGISIPEGNPIHSLSLQVIIKGSRIRGRGSFLHSI